MKPFTLFFIAVCLFHTAAIAKNEETPVKHIISGFRENKGQLIDQHNNKRSDILYYGSSDQMSYYLKKDGMSYQLYKKSEKSDEVTIQRLDIRWLGVNPRVKTEVSRAVGGFESFYNTPDGKEVLNVKAFESIEYQELYTGIDAKYYYQDGSLKYDYIIKPFSDYRKISFKIEGADKIVLNEDGTVTMKTPLGNITEGKPVAYQDGKVVNANWILQDNVLSFAVENYDVSKELVIDPLVYGWTSFFGFVRVGTNNHGGTEVYFPECDVNINGDFFVINSTRIFSNLPPSSSTTYELEMYNASGVKNSGFSGFNSLGPNTLLMRSVSIDKLTPYVSGSTAAQNIATTGAYQISLAGSNDLFLTKFDAGGSLIWTTYYGGAGNDSIGQCATDKMGGVYIAGYTKSVNNISTPSSYQPILQGISDVFIVRFDTNGYRRWGTYFGGNGVETLSSCAASNNLITIVGQTNSQSSISNINAHQPNYSGGKNNSFVATFDSLGSLMWSTYYGDSTTSITNCEIDRAENVLVCGKTKANANISSAGSHQSSSGGGTDGFLVKFNRVGVRLWGTYYGGSLDDDATALSVNGSDYFICGITNSPNNISTPFAPFANLGSGGYISKFDTGGVRLFGTYFSVQSINDCSADNSGNLFLIGDAYNSPPSSSTRSTAHLSIFYYCNPQPLITATNTSFCKGSSVSLSTSYSSNNYRWIRNDTLISGNNNATLTTSKSGTYKLMVDNCAVFSNAITLTEIPTPSANFTKRDILCYETGTGEISLINVTGGTPPYTYAWDSFGNFSYLPLPFNTPTLQNLYPGTYRGHAIDVNGCTSSHTVGIDQESITPPSNPLPEICAVTVDSATGKNLIIWEKTGDVRAVKYNLYAEGSQTNQFNLIGSRNVGQLSTFLDVNSNPLQQSYVYKISEVDSCNHENPLSNFHKTIHLTANLGVNGEINLTWNPYEGRPYSSHYVMRSFNGGPFVLLNQVSNSITSYSDLTPPIGYKVYRIDIDLATTCTPQKTTAYNFVSSNNVGIKDSNIVTPPVDLVTQIVPNPTSGIITIQGIKPATVRLFDAVGRIVKEARSAGTINLSDLPAAIYLIKMYNEKGEVYHQQKIVKK
jgi:hypothetical protein